MNPFWYGVISGAVALAAYYLGYWLGYCDAIDKERGWGRHKR